MDTTGEQHLHIEHNIFKRRLDLNGKPIEDPQRTSKYNIPFGIHDTNVELELESHVKKCFIADITDAKAVSKTTEKVMQDFY